GIAEHRGAPHPRLQSIFPVPSERPRNAIEETARIPPKVVETIGETIKLDLLAIAAHPDDVELTCGGTLIKMAQRGYKTGVLDLTAGEMGTRGTVETRAKEAAKAAKLMGLSYRGVLGVPDSDVQ